MLDEFDGELDAAVEQAEAVAALITTLADCAHEDSALYLLRELAALELRDARKAISLEHAAQRLRMLDLLLSGAVAACAGRCRDMADRTARIEEHRSDVDEAAAARSWHALANALDALQT